MNKKISILSMEHPLERPLLRAVSILLIALSCTYLYFVASTVLNIMARKEALAQTAQIEGAIGDAESRFFALSQAITPASGAELGLVPISATQYVTRPGNVGMADESPSAARSETI